MHQHKGKPLQHVKDASLERTQGIWGAGCSEGDRLGETVRWSVGSIVYKGKMFCAFLGIRRANVLIKM
jgi:hypothetical protein